MAQILERFEELIEPHLPDTSASDTQAFKAFLRTKLSAFAHDVTDVIEPGEINGVAQDIRDRLSLDR
jgi:hypothetical protein